MGRETIDKQIFRVMKQSEQPVSTREIALRTGRAWHSVNAHCLRLQVEGRLVGFKIGNIYAWQLKGGRKK